MCIRDRDKAVSKWERGLSVPDISLLVPLAEQLNVTVAELLQGCRVEEEQRFTREETEELIRKALIFSEMCIRDRPEGKGAIRFEMASRPIS